MGATSSNFYTGAVFRDLNLNWDVTALDGLLMATTNFLAKFPAAERPARMFWWLWARNHNDEPQGV